MRKGTAWVPGTGREGVVLVTGSQQIRDETARVAAAAGVELHLRTSLYEAHLLQPSLVLVGSDHPEPRPAAGAVIIVVGLPGEEAAAWEAAARLRASGVAILPGAADWLAERFASLRASGLSGRLLGVMGSVGGVGASSLSCWLALAAVQAERTALLIDGDCAGGGLAEALGAADRPGIRWDDLRDVNGALNPEQLAGVLPAVSGFQLLSMSGVAGEASIVASPAAQSVIDAVRGMFQLSILDLPSGWPWGGPLGGFCDEVVLLVPGRARAIAAARAMVEHTEPLSVSIVARGPLAQGLDPHRVAELVGRPLAGYLPHLRGVRDAERQGRLLEGGSRRPVRRLTAEVLAAVPAGRRAAHHG